MAPTALPARANRSSIPTVDPALFSCCTSHANAGRNGSSQEAARYQSGRVGGLRGLAWRGPGLFNCSRLSLVIRRRTQDNSPAILVWTQIQHRIRAECAARVGHHRIEGTRSAVSGSTSASDTRLGPQPAPYLRVSYTVLPVSSRYTARAIAWSSPSL